jgi:hypothetical protein
MDLALPRTSEVAMNTNLGIAAVLSIGVMIWAYSSGFYPVYAVLGCIGIMVFLAFKNTSRTVSRSDARLCLPPDDPQFVE